MVNLCFCFLCPLDVSLLWETHSWSLVNLRNKWFLNFEHGADKAHNARGRRSFLGRGFRLTTTKSRPFALGHCGMFAYNMMFGKRAKVSPRFCNICNSSWEPIRRDNLFHRVNNGRLGLSHLFVRQFVSRFFFLRDQDHPFISAFIQTKLSPHLLTFVVSSYGGESSRLYGFHKEVVDAFHFLSSRFGVSVCGNQEDAKTWLGVKFVSCPAVQKCHLQRWPRCTQTC